MSRPEPRLLLGPGPSIVPPAVLQAMARPVMGHLDPDFLAVMDSTRKKLRQVFRTENALTFPLSGTGSAGMEAALVNVLEPGDRLLVAVNGYFGTRLADIGKRLGARVEEVAFEWGEPVTAEKLQEALAQERAAAVALVHAETSTGIGSPVRELAELGRRMGALVIVDCVTSLAGMPVEIDAWGIDVAYSGSQKCLSSPPGLAPFTMSERAVHKLRSRKTPVPSFYLDASLLEKYWGSERSYHHTAPISLVYALEKSLELALEEGLEARFRRHRDVHDHLVAELGRLGLELLGEKSHRLPMLNAVKLPAGSDEAALRRELLDRYGIEVGGGFGPLKGKIIRVGLMGHSCHQENVDRLITALRILLNSNGQHQASRISR
ncbi:MAG: alanine--glyoxylate aminotransferase family protein [Planctomycetota bacterium]